MSRLVKISGVVIKRVDLSDNDIIATIFTKEKGKIQVVAKGARKNKSQFVGTTQMFCYGNYVYYRGKNLGYLNQAELIESFYKLRNDLGRLSVATYMAEVLNLSFQEYNRDDRVLNLLLHSLHLLNSNETKDIIAVLLGFQLKFMGFMGYAPHLKNCVNCSRQSNVFYFSNKSGGVLCDKCIETDRTAVKISNTGLNALNKILYCDIKKLDKLQYNKDLLRFLTKIMNYYISYHLDKNIYSYKFMETIS